jgi:hypothetical protein
MTNAGVATRCRGSVWVVTDGPERSDRSATPSESQVRALDVDGVSAVAVGTVAWTVALIVLLFARTSLETSGRTWWLWVCVSGALFGCAGLVFLVRRRNRRLSR